MSIRTDLEEISGVTKKKKESEAEYLKRLIIAVDEKLTDEMFDELSDETQDWINSAIEAVEDGIDIPPFPDEEDNNAVSDKVEEEEDDEEYEEVEETKPAKKAKPEKKKEPVTAKPAAKDTKKEKEKPAKAKPAAKDTKKEKEKPEKATKQPTKPARTSSKSSVAPSLRIVQLAVEFPQASIAELTKMLKKEGSELSVVTVRTKAHIAREALSYLKSIGRVK